MARWLRTAEFGLPLMGRAKHDAMPNGSNPPWWRDSSLAFFGIPSAI